jgi:Terminase small subunit
VPSICMMRNSDIASGKLFSLGERLRNSRHERFAREVAALTPLATAYREAGFGGDPRWHPFNASKLANKPRVRARIDELRLEFEKMSAIHVDYVRHQLLRIIEADPRDLYEPDPADPTGKRRKLRSISDLPRHLTAAIARLKIDPETGEPVDVTFAGKNEAAATLLRSLPGGSIERHEHVAPDGEMLGQIERALGQLLGIGDAKLLGELQQALSATNAASTRILGPEGASREKLGPK